MQRSLSEPAEEREACLFDGNGAESKSGAAAAGATLSCVYARDFTHIIRF